MDDEEERVIFPNTHDPLSAIFYLMQKGLDGGNEIDLSINTNQTNYRIYGRVSQKKKITIGGRIFDICLVEGHVKRRDGSIRHSSNFSMWFLQKPRLPVLIKVFTNMGSVTARFHSTDK